MKKILFFISLFILAVNVSNGQVVKKKRIKAKPKDYKRPVQRTDVVEMHKFEVNDLPKDKKSFWAVVNVQDGKDENYTYDKPNGRNRKFKLEFLEAFYVIDEEGEWIELGKPLKENLDDRKVEMELYGWIHKSDMLLWSNSLSTVNLIHLKAFSVNSVSGLSKKQDLNKVKVYDHWDFENANEIGELPLESFYYIYKKRIDPVSETPQAYLVGKDNFFEPFDKNSKCLLGWIKQERVDPWNTRLAIAPCFNPGGYNERYKRKDELRMRGYSKKSQADKYIKKRGDSHESGILWDYDPVIERDDFISKNDKKRLSKDLMRLPILNSLSNSKVVRSTTLQTLSSGSSESNTVDKMKLSGKEAALDILDNVNVYFLLDGSSAEVKKQIPIIKETIREIGVNSSNIKNLRIGAGVYLDCKSSCDTPFTSKSLSQDKDRTLNFLDKVIRMDCPSDRDPATCVQHGVLKSLKQANFTQDGASNIFFHIGDQGDIKSYPNRKMDSRRYSDKNDEIQELLRKYSINYIAVDVSQERGNLFLENIRPLISVVMNEIVSDNIDRLERGGLNVDDILNADLPSFPTTGSINITAQSCPLIYTMMSPTENQTISSMDLKRFLLNSYNDFKQKILKTSKVTSDLAENGIQNYKGASFPPEILLAIEMQLKKSSQGEITDAELREFFDRSKGVKFQKEVYIPMDYKAWGGKYTPYSYVLFMPGDDLYNFTESIRKLLDAYDSPSEARERLRGALEKLVLTLTGEKKVDKNFSLEDLEKLVIGLESTTLDLTENNSLLSVKIRDVENSRKFSDEMFIKYRDILRKRKEVLEEIRQPGGNYEFKYKTSRQNEYYWITLDNMISIN